MKAMIGMVLMLCLASVTRGELLSYYPFDGDMIDVQGLRDGRIVGSGVTFSTTDKKVGGGALHLDGNGYVSLPGGADALNGLTAFTVAMWVKIDGEPTGSDIAAFFTTRDYTEKSVQLNYHTGSSMEGYFNGLGETAAVPAGWFHIAYTYDGSVTRLYLNGSEVASRDNRSGQTADLGQVCAIGAWDSIWGPMRYLTGSIDDLRIYSEALSVREIKTLAGITLLSYYPFDGDMIDVQGLRDGHIVGSGVTFSTTDKKIGSGALHLDGNGYVSLPGGANALNGLTAFTVATWVKIDGEPTGSDIAAFFTTRDYTERSVQLNYHTGSSMEGYFNGLGETAAVPAGWFHIAYTYDGSVTCLYLNGSEVASRDNRSGQTADLGQVCAIGAWDSIWGSMRYLTGSIDDLRIYSVALSVREIKALAGIAMPSGLLSYYPFDSDMRDAQGLRNGNIIGSGVTISTTDKKVGGGALQLNGSGYVGLPGGADALNGLTAFTVAAWVKIDGESIGSDLAALFATQDYTEKSVHLNYYVGSPGGIGGYFDGMEEYPSTSVVPAGWFHIAYTYDGSVTRFYINGGEVASRYGRLGRTADLGQVCAIGAWDSIWGPMRYLTGLIDDLRIYSEALNVSDIRTMMIEIPQVTLGDGTIVDGRQLADAAMPVEGSAANMPLITDLDAATYGFLDPDNYLAAQGQRSVLEFTWGNCTVRNGRGIDLLIGEAFEEGAMISVYVEGKGWTGYYWVAPRMNIQSNGGYYSAYDFSEMDIPLNTVVTAVRLSNVLPGPTIGLYRTGDDFGHAITGDADGGAGYVLTHTGPHPQYLAAVNITPAIAGDANMDGRVDVSDLGILAANYGVTAGAAWGTGDFNGDGKVNVSDLGILAANYGTGTGMSLDFNKDAQSLGLTVDGSETAKEDAPVASVLGCNSAGLPLVAGLTLLGLLLVKLDE